jgi:spermidine synthase
VNGKTDAGSGAEDVLTQKFIGHVPMLLHPGPRDVLVIGWGAGATAAAVATYPLQSLECVEIEPATWHAAPLFAGLSGRVREDPRLRMVFRDGRNHLLRSAQAWDVVVSEPSNPWIAGVSNLFTLEFYEAVRARLRPRGLFGQWFHYYNLEPEDVKVELRTFARAFPHVSVWVVPPVGGEGGTLSADLLLVGSLEPHALEWSRLQEALAGGPVGDDLRATGVVEDAAALLAAWTLDREALERYVQAPGATRAAPLNTDDTPWIEFAAPRRNVLPPAEVARQARAQYLAFAQAAPAAMAPLDGAPPAGESAVLLRAVADRHVEAARPGRALAALQRAAVLDPSSADVWERLAGLYLDGRDYPRAEEAHRTLVRLRPADVPAHLRLGAVLARLGRWTDARAALLEARRLDAAAPVDAALLEFVERQAAR